MKAQSSSLLVLPLEFVGEPLHALVNSLTRDGHRWAAKRVREGVGERTEQKHRATAIPGTRVHTTDTQTDKTSKHVHVVSLTLCLHTHTHTRAHTTPTTSTDKMKTRMSEDHTKREKHSQHDSSGQRDKEHHGDAKAKGHGGWEKHSPRGDRQDGPASAVDGGQVKILHTLIGRQGVWHILLVGEKQNGDTLQLCASTQTQPPA